MKYYFYCPDCQRGEQLETLPDGTKEFDRKDFGRNLYYKECPSCKSQDAAYVNIEGFQLDSTGYWQSMIEYYKNNRSIAL